MRTVQDDTAIERLRLRTWMPPTLALLVFVIASPGCGQVTPGSGPEDACEEFAAGSRLVDGACTCPESEIICSAICVPSDESNCGGCGRECGPRSVCEADACIAPGVVFELDGAPPSLWLEVVGPDLALTSQPDPPIENPEGVTVDGADIRVERLPEGRYRVCVVGDVENAPSGVLVRIRELDGSTLGEFPLPDIEPELLGLGCALGAPNVVAELEP